MSSLYETKLNNLYDKILESYSIEASMKNEIFKIVLDTDNSRQFNVIRNATNKLKELNQDIPYGFLAKFALGIKYNKFMKNIQNKLSDVDNIISLDTSIDPRMSVLSNSRKLFKFCSIFSEQYMEKGYPFEDYIPPRVNHNNLNLLRALYYICYFLLTTNFLVMEDINTYDIILIQLASFLKSSGRVNEAAGNMDAIKIKLNLLLDVFNIDHTSILNEGADVEKEFTLIPLRFITGCIAYMILESLQIPGIKNSKYYNCFVLSMIIDEESSIFTDEFKIFTKLVSIGHYLDHCRTTTGYSQLDTEPENMDPSNNQEGMGPIWLRKILMKYYKTDNWIECKKEYLDVQYNELIRSGFDRQSEDNIPIGESNRNRCSKVFGGNEDFESPKFLDFCDNFFLAWTELLIHPLVKKENSCNYDAFLTDEMLYMSKDYSNYCLVSQKGNKVNAENILIQSVPIVRLLMPGIEELWEKEFREYLKTEKYNPQQIDDISKNTRLLYSEIYPKDDKKNYITHDWRTSSISDDGYEYDLIKEGTVLFRGVQNKITKKENNTRAIKNIYANSGYLIDNEEKSKILPTYYSPNVDKAFGYLWTEEEFDKRSVIQVLTVKRDIILLKMDSQHNLEKILEDVKDNKELLESVKFFFSVKSTDEPILGRLSSHENDFRVLDYLCKNNFDGYSANPFGSFETSELAICNASELLRLELLISINETSDSRLTLTDIDYILNDIVSKKENITKEFIETGEYPFFNYEDRKIPGHLASPEFFNGKQKSFVDKSSGKNTSLMQNSIPSLRNKIGKILEVQINGLAGRDLKYLHGKLIKEYNVNINDKNSMINFLKIHEP